MEIVIKIGDKLYDLIKHYEKPIEIIEEENDTLEITLMRAIINGTPLLQIVDSLKELSKDHRHNYISNSHEERAWQLGIEDSIDLLLTESEVNADGDNC